MPLLKSAHLRRWRPWLAACSTHRERPPARPSGVAVAPVISLRVFGILLGARRSNVVREQGPQSRAPAKPARSDLARIFFMNGERTTGRSPLGDGWSEHGGSRTLWQDPSGSRVHSFMNNPW
jgi:hypothetical protein